MFHEQGLTSDRDRDQFTPNTKSDIMEGDNPFLHEQIIRELRTNPNTLPVQEGTSWIRIGKALFRIDLEQSASWQFNLLESLYKFDNKDEIWVYLTRNKDLYTVLIEMKTILHSYFNGTEILMRYISHTDDDDECEVISIEVLVDPATIETALDTLAVFDRNWLLGKLPAINGRIVVTLDGK